NGSGGFASTVQATAPTASTIATFSSGPLSGVGFSQISTTTLFALDYDNDGDQDLFEPANNTTTTGTAVGRIIRNNGNGSFTDLNTSPFTALQFGARRIFFDADGDGDLDMLFQNGNVAGAGIAFSTNNGSGGFASTIQATAPTASTIASFSSGPLSGVGFSQISTTTLFALDYDNDGDQDLFEPANNTTTTGTAVGRIIRQNGAPPKLTSTSPADNATNINPVSSLTLTFNTNVVKGTGNLFLVRISDNTVIETIAVTSGQVTGSGTTWVIDPNSTLADNTGYAIRMAKAVFRDSDNRAFAGISQNTTFNFTTGVANKVPTNITLSVNTVAENASPNTVVGTFSTTDADVGQTFSYSLVAGAGSTDNASFKLVGNQLQTNATFDYETKNSYSIRVSTTDNGAPALSFEKSFTISITNVNEFLSFNPSTSLTVCAGAPVSLTVTPTGFTPTNYAWSSSPAGFSGSGASLTQFSQNAPSVSSNTSFTILVTASNGPSSVTASTTVVVNARPIASLTNNGPLISLQSSVTLTAGGGGTYAFGDGASQVGGGNTATVTTTGLFSVTVTGVTGCQATATTNVTAVPDLIPILHVQPSTQYGTTNFIVVVDVFELTPVATSGQIVVNISKDPMVVLSFNGSASSVGGLTVQNSSWSFDATSNPDAYILTTNTAIGASSKLAFGLNGVSTPGATKGTLTVSSVVTGSGVGEIRINNNSDSDKINYFSK
ncbi:Ig-like domain-containing protein, partial [Spirosoma jeollabukense]